MSQSETSNSPISDISEVPDIVESSRGAEAIPASAETSRAVESLAMEQADVAESAADVSSGAGDQENSDAEHRSVEALAAQARQLFTQLQAEVREWLTGVRLPPSPRTMRLLVVVGSSALLLMLLPALLNGSHNPAGAERALPTATVVPTATPLPSPTAMAGYQPLVDSEDGFVIQFPLAWSCSPSNPGVDCIDSPDAQNYRLQVQLPGGWTGANTGKDPNDASVWVNYALSAFSDVPGRTYERLPDTGQTTTIGGVAWQSGAAVVGMEPDTDSSNATPTPTQPPVRIHVQVYATVYGGKPYIIALYAADDQFAAGTQRYFQPMLNSFAFLPQGSQQ